MMGWIGVQGHLEREAGCAKNTPLAYSHFRARTHAKAEQGRGKLFAGE
jgi:hypothetical protein